jgi:ketosteroid isomerase-like protein
VEPELIMVDADSSLTNQHDARWVQDQIEIRILIERYSDAACRSDSSALMDLWADDCRWSVPDMRGLENVRGKPAIKALWDGARDIYPFCFLVAQPGIIDIQGDQATARVYTTEVLRAADGAVRHAVGRYDDTLRRIDGRWVFTERVWYILHNEQGR